MASETSPKQHKPRASDGGGIQVLSRAAEILRALKADNSGLSLGQMADRVELPRSTVQRIVNALVDEGLVAPNRISGGYQLGPEIAALAIAARIDLQKMLHPILERLSRETGETVDLATFRDDKMVFLDQVVGSQRLRTVSAIGESFPMTVTANGKAALSLLPDDQVDRLIKSERGLRQNGSTAAKVLSEIRQVGELGYALDVDEHTKGISAVGIAFAAGAAVYAISVPAPTQRFTEKRDSLIEKLCEAGNEVRAALQL